MAAATLVPAYADDAPLNPIVCPLLTDMYQITMTYGYWKAGRHRLTAVFDLFFRKNPFGGEFTIFAGLEEVLRFLSSFRVTPEHVAFLKELLPDAEAEFWDYIAGLDCSEVTMHAVPEGSVVFPRVPVVRVEGPVAVCQLIETPLLNLCNYASLMTTNAARFRLAAGADKTLLEFGLRRAQGPDGAMSATRYSIVGGFDGTSNVMGGLVFGVHVSGTMAHSFVTSYSSMDELRERTINGVDMVVEATRIRAEIGFDSANDSELASFIAYAQAHPRNFLALVDTYDTLRSGVPNFIAVAIALQSAGYKPVGVRLDSGDLAYLSKAAREMFVKWGDKYGVDLARCTIVASNDINEAVLHSLNEQGHSIDAFGIGTNLVTCQAQPALGMVYKLVEIDGMPRIKLSQEISKVTIPGSKDVYRLCGADGGPIVDLLLRTGERPPTAGTQVLCRAPFDATKRVNVVPSSVVQLLSPAWVGKRVAVAGGGGGDDAKETEGHASGDGGGSGGDGRVVTGRRREFQSVIQLRSYVREQLKALREDHLRALNPTPYKVSVSSALYTFLRDLWELEVPIPELS